MKILLTKKEKGKAYSTVTEILSPAFCANIGWIKSSDVQIPGEEFLITQDEVEAQVDWRIYNGKLSDPKDPLFEDLLTLKKEEIANERYIEEVSGINFYGVEISSDDRSKSLIKAAYDRSIEDDTFQTRWKTSSGDFRPIDCTTIKAIYNAISQHVDMCFRKEAAILDVLSECKTVAEIQEISWNMEVIDSFQLP